MATELFHITLSTHNFSVTKLTPRARGLVMEFAKRNVQYGLVRIPGGRYVNAAVKVFGSATNDRTEFRFHINQYKQFCEHLKANYITESLFTLEAKSVPITPSIEINVKENWVPREEQLPVIDYLMADAEYRSRFVNLQTGKGKSLVSMIAMAAFGKRIVIIVKSMYIEKWIEDLLKTYEITVKDIMMVRGSVQLQALIQMATDGTLKSNFIIIGNKTMQNWLKLYELEGAETLNAGYGCLPEDFYETVGAGMRLIDEVHQDFHLNFKLDLYTNVERSISLSATLLNNDSFLEDMYKIAYPIDERYHGGPLDKYVIARSVCYNFKPGRHFNTTEYGSSTYSHMAFEKSIMKNKELCDNYMKLIWNTLDIGFMPDYKKGQKATVFCSSIAFCTKMTHYLQQKYPQFDVRRCVEDDPYENMIEPDIRVTTILSGGTAHDIPNLKTVVLSIAIDSVQANVQTMGRLRKLPDSGVYFYYLVCQDIPKHLVYHERKKKMLQERAFSFMTINAPFLV